MNDKNFITKRYVTKDGKNVIFYMTGYCICNDIDIEPGVEELIFKEYMTVQLSNVCKQFPDVKRIIIENENISSIYISNFMFPNVREVVSYSKYFKSGSMLVRYNSGRISLQNTFCLRPDECVDLKNINYIENFAFEGCMTQNIINCESLRYCDEDAFHGSASEIISADGVIKAGKILIDARNVSSISDTGCEFMLSTVPEKIEKIEITNFNILNNTNKLPKTVVIHDVEHLDRTAAETIQYRLSSSDIQNIEIDKASKAYQSIDGIIYSKDGKTLIKCPCGKENPTIQEGTERICKNAFANCDKLESIDFPDSVKILEQRAFYNCQNLKSVHFGTGIQSIGSDINSDVFMGCGFTELLIPGHIKQIGNGAFYGCPLSNLTLSEGIEEIGDSAFSYYGYKPEKRIETIKIPESIKYIGNNNFAGVSDVYITGKRMPVGLFQNVTLSSGGNRKNEEEKYGNVTIHIGSYDMFVPRNPIDRSRFDSLFSNIDIDIVGDDLINSLYKYACNIIDEQNVAILVYERTHDENVKKYLKESNRKILNRLMKSDDEDMLIRFLRLGFISKRSLQSLLKKVQDKSMLSTSAYIMSEINKQSNTKNGKKVCGPKFTL